MRAHCRWLVDTTWTKYLYNQQDTSTVGLRVTDFESDIQRSGETVDLDLFNDTTHIQIDRQNAKLEFPGTMQTGYADLNIAVQGVAAINLRDDPGESDLTPMVGKHVIANVSAFIDSSTVFDSSKPTKFEIDVGKLLVGAVWLSGPTLTTGGYYRRVSGVLSGLLAASIAGLWKVSLAWQIHHGKAINDAYDNFILYVDVQVYGYDGTRALLLVEH